LGDIIPDPMPVPPMDQKFSGAKMKFQDMNVYGLSGFRLKHVRMNVNDLEVTH